MLTPLDALGMAEENLLRALDVHRPWSARRELMYATLGQIAVARGLLDAEQPRQLRLDMAAERRTMAGEDEDAGGAVGEGECD